MSDKVYVEKSEASTQCYTGAKVAGLNAPRSGLSNELPGSRLTAEAEVSHILDQIGIAYETTVRSQSLVVWAAHSNSVSALRRGILEIVARLQAENEKLRDSSATHSLDTALNVVNHALGNRGDLAILRVLRDSNERPIDTLRR